MACSRFEYVKTFESHNKLLKNCWIVIRIDGRHFTDFSRRHNFEKPNDLKALQLMEASALYIMGKWQDIELAYGQSDEFSFVFKKKTECHQRREAKLVSSIASEFTAAYLSLWPTYKSDVPLQPDHLPSFDARAVCYPSDENLRDYLSWRQADCHINNLYNTCFWGLVNRKGLTQQEAQDRLKGTLSSHKNELLFSEFNINYNNEPQQFRKGSVIYRNPQKSDQKLMVEYIDIIGDNFWFEHSQILESKQKRQRSR